MIGRFLSPDIVIQAEGNLQNYNRYSYVLNNPLKYTDPSGNEIFSIIATIIAIGETGLKAHQLFLLFFTAGFLDAYAESGDVGVSLKAGLISGTSAYFAHEIGTWFKDGWAADAFAGPTLANVVKATFHGVRGGIAAELSGGNFGAGAGAAFFGDYAGGLAGEYIGEGLIVSAVLGGTASEIGGGKFSNGALSGAMTFVLNTARHRKSDGGDVGPGGRDWTFEKVVAEVQRLRKAHPNVDFIPAPKSLIGNPLYYVFRFLAAPSAYHHSGLPNEDYLLNYGFKYANIFTDLETTTSSQKIKNFVVNTRIALQETMEVRLAANPSIARSMGRLREMAFDIHSSSYEVGGFGQLSILEKTTVISNIDRVDIVKPESKKEIKEFFYIR